MLDLNRYKLTTNIGKYLLIVNLILQWLNNNTFNLLNISYVLNTT